MSEMYETGTTRSIEPPRGSATLEAQFDARRRELGVEDGLKDIPGITTQMLVEFGECGVKSIEDLASCATDDLDGWSEHKGGKTIRHAGILDRVRISRQQCEAMIINARIRAGRIKESA